MTRAKVYPRIVVSKITTVDDFAKGGQDRRNDVYCCVVEFKGQQLMWQKALPHGWENEVSVQMLESEAVDRLTERLMKEIG